MNKCRYIYCTIENHAEQCCEINNICPTPDKHNNLYTINTLHNKFICNYVFRKGKNVGKQCTDIYNLCVFQKHRPVNKRAYLSNNYQCERCFYNFSTKSNLNRHQRYSCCMTVGQATEISNIMNDIITKLEH